MTKSGTKQKHVPQRTCVICREVHPKRELTRLVRTPTGVIVDLTGKQNGRGAYLCYKLSCWEKAETGNVLADALRATLTQNDRDMLSTHRQKLVQNNLLEQGE